METEEFLNIKVFSKITNKYFIEGLERAPKLLKANQASLFFKTVLEHFQFELPLELGENILKSISKCLCIEENLKCFLDGNYVSQLPSKQSSFISQVFNIFYILVFSGAKMIEENCAPCLQDLIHADSKKSLTLIAIYCQQFGELDNPWPIVDLLIQEGKYFVTPSVAPDYVSLLAYLNKKYIEYKDGRSPHCWNQICSMLNSSDPLTLRSCYGGLCTMSTLYTDGSLPIEIVSNHLKLPDLQDSVLAMLNVATLSEKDSSNGRLISALFSIAENNVKGTLVLMKLGCNLRPAQLILNYGQWLLEPLPTMIDTLRLFLVVLRHKELREQIVNSDDFINFLKAIIDIDRNGMVPITCTIIRRVPLSKEFVTGLSRVGFLKKFYEMDESGDDGLTQHSKLLLTDTICRVCYAKEYLIVCERISQIIQDREEFADAASLVAVRLCKFPPCRDKMKELKLDLFFKRNRNDQKFASIAKKFLRSVADESE